jgi:hypothetical protein
MSKGRLSKDDFEKRMSLISGTTDFARLSQADVVVEGEYRTGAQEQLYLEPQGIVALPQDGGITIYGSLQCPYYVHAALRALLALPAERVRVIQMETGGGFGGKEEYPSIIAGHAALLALKSGRPVKLVYDRAEDMAATTKRHPALIRHRTGVARDGRLTAVLPSDRAFLERDASPAELEALIGVALTPSELMDVLVGARPESLRDYRADWGESYPRRIDAVLDDGTRLKATVEDADAGAGVSPRAFDPPPHDGYREVDADEARRLLGGR